MVLTDTTIWIDHFRSADANLIRLLTKNEVLLHPWVIAELALGSLGNRLSVLRDLEKRPQAKVASVAEVRFLIEGRKLYARGIGLIDAQLLASTLFDSRIRIWTRDRRLGQIADQLGIRAAIP
jgi:predicted nucleic acid-binding protein